MMDDEGVLKKLREGNKAPAAIPAADERPAPPAPAPAAQQEVHDAIDEEAE